MTLHPTISQTQRWKKTHQKIVLVTGVFDLLHIEHIRFLTKAKQSGDKLIVGLETDARVKTIKGKNRPLNNQQIRLEQLQALKCVDLAFLLPQKFNTPKDWEKLIVDLKPDIYAVSSHTSHLKTKKQIVQKHDCQFKIVHQYNPNISTTILLSKLNLDS